MYRYFVVIDNELADLQEDNIICNRRMRSSSTKFAQTLKNATDVETYQTIFGDWIGWSREHNVFFWYTDESDDIRIFLSLAELEDSYFDRFSSYESGCNCDDCKQEAMDIFATRFSTTEIVLDDLRSEMRHLFDDAHASGPAE